MKRLTWLALLLPALAAAQLVGGVNSISRPILTSVDPGYDTIPTLSEESRRNAIYTDGTRWDPGTDAIPAELDDGLSRQIVTVASDAASSSATYWTLNAREAQDVYVCRDDAATVSHAAAYSDWEDTGIDVTRFAATYSCLTKGFPAGEFNIPGCNSNTLQCIIFVRNQTAPTPQLSRGVLQFSASSLAVNEGDTITFTLQRVGGVAGTCEGTVTEGAGSGNGVLVSTSAFEWAANDATPQNGTATAGSVSGDQTYVLNLGSIAGCDAGARTALTVTIRDTDTTPAAQEYFVDGGSGSDGNNGTSAGTAWETIGRANASVAAVAGGDVVVWIEDQGAGCDYRDEVIRPTNSGTDATHRIIFKPRGGDVTLCGPSSGSMTHAIRIDDGINFIEVQEDSGNRFIVDGEVVFGTSAGQAQKCASGTCPTSTLPEGVDHISQGAYVAGDDVMLDYDHIRTAGWSGLTLTSSADRSIIRMNADQHGTPHYTGNADWGDLIATSSSAGLKEYLIDGGTSGRTYAHPGHAHLGFFGGRVLVRGLVMDGAWDDIPTFSVPDGDRLIFYHRNARQGSIHDVIINRNGKGKDQAWQECIKLEGRENSISTSVIRNCHFAAIRSDEASWSDYAEFLRYSHLTVDNVGVLLDSVDWSQFPGDSYLQSVKLKNIIARNVAPNERSGFDDEVLHIVFNTALAGNWQNQLEIKGLTIEDATRNCSQLYFDISGAGAPGRQTITYYQTNFPSVVSDITCTTDANLDNAPSESADSDFTNWVTHWTPVSDTISTATGVDLTNASSAGSNSQQICVDDVLYFPDPDSFPAPGVGQHSGGYQIHIGGVGNVTYTDRVVNTRPAGCLNLASPQSWDDNAPVNLKISTGGANDTPNRGAML